jgi:DNA recombination protein RmuC
MNIDEIGFYAITGIVIVSLVVSLITLINVRHILGGARKSELGVESITATVSASTQQLSSEFTGIRKEYSDQQRSLREEVSSSITKYGEASARQLERAAKSQHDSLESLGNRFQGLNQSVSDHLSEMRKSIDARLSSLRDSLEKSSTELRKTVDGKLTEIRDDNATKLEKMRATVDEKLQSTLEKRLGESFNLVNERLEAVHKGLGEMQQLANGVGDLKRVLTNVKTRGGWGEIQLGQLISDMLAPNQYEENVAVIKGSAARVEFAIKVPVDGGYTWLPVDAKFPKEDYERLVDAAEKADKESVEKASKQLEITLKGCAKTIAEKYIKTPDTTDYAVLYLPTEGLFAEIARKPGLTEFIQQNYRVVVAGPTTFSAVLTSLQLAFRTLAIQQRGDEVWKVLGSTKAEFSKFGDVIDKVNKKITEAGNQLEQVGVRSRAIERSLSSVEALDYEQPNPMPSPSRVLTS